MVYHYTNFQALKGIIRQDCIQLWATRYDKLNDPKEYTWAQEYVIQHLQDLANELSVVFDHEYQYYPYVISLCKKSDDLKMWRLYANNGTGVQLGFDEKILQQNAVEGKKVENTGGSNPDYFMNCHYAKENDRNTITQALEEFRNKFGETVSGGNDLYDACSFIKREGYEFEDEMRYIRPNYDCLHATPQTIDTCEWEEDVRNVKYRIRDNESVPYQDVQFPKEALKEISVGYKNNFEKRKCCLEMLLKKHGYENIQIKHSKFLKNEMKNTVFFGNGLNLIVDRTLSWKSLFSGCRIAGKNPNTMAYDKIVLDTNIQYGIRIKKGIAEKLETVKTNRIYELLYKSKIRNFITTNYDYGFTEQHDITDSENLYSIRRVKVLKDKQGRKKYFWQIHGEINHPESIMLGLNHYCGSVGKIGDYLKGKYVARKEETMKDKIKSGKFSDTYWIDLFFKTNLHIIGYGLDFSETDIWRILIWRAKLKQDLEFRDKIKNVIHFYCTPKIKKEESKKIELLESFDVVVHVEKTKNEHPDFDFYERIIKQLDKTI
jgi:hypothetical protein